MKQTVAPLAARSPKLRRALPQAKGMHIHLVIDGALMATTLIQQ
jgi:hypothetical protein